jgi:hypothetical protein
MYRVYITVDREGNGKTERMYYYIKDHDTVSIEEQKYTTIETDKIIVESIIEIRVRDTIEKSE